MNRRGLLTLAAGLPAWAAPLRAQPVGAARRRIGVLSFGAAPSGTDPDPIDGFRLGPHELGHDEGRSLLIEYRYADGRPERLAALALQHQLPSISEIPVLADAGFLLSYGADLNALVRRAAGYVDRILQGARPAELAIERPSVLELVVNLRTARALGIRLAPALLPRAGRVIA